MLEVKHLCADIDRMPIITDISLTVGDGEIVSLIGANGAGKTTLVRALTKLNPASSGTILWNGEDITQYTADKLVNMGMIHVPEGRALFSRMTVKENLEIGAYCHHARAKAAENLAFVYELFPELKEMGAKAAGDLSGGQQQMVAIGRGIMADPKLLILDEPSIGLSPLMTQKVLKAVQAIRDKGVSVLISEQNVMAVLGMANHAYVMQQGKIILSGTAEGLKNNDAVRKAYMGI